MSIEREVKLGVWSGFTLPDLTDVAHEVSVRARPVKTLNAVYHDTPDLRLARWGITLRHRSGEGSKWTLKLPEGDEGPALVRREVDFDGPEDHMPTGAADLVLAYSRGMALVPVAELHTIRSGVDLVDGAGAKLAEVVDDEVSIIHEGRVAARFREVEVELGQEAPAGLLEKVVSRLREAGAGAPDSTPKVMRALSPRAVAPPDVEVEALGRKATVADVVTQAIAASVIRILRHDPGVRMGDDPEDVHQARVGTRRLRSDTARKSSRPAWKSQHRTAGRRYRPGSVDGGDGRVPAPGLDEVVVKALCARRVPAEDVCESATPATIAVWTDPQFTPAPSWRGPGRSPTTSCRCPSPTSLLQGASHQ